MGQSLPKDSLILYKNRPARILQPGDKLDIETDSGKTAKVRPKDVTLLHPGPVKNLLGLTPPPGDVETAWELLAGQTTSLAELAELIFDEFTPATAWAVWQLLDDGLYFRGSITEIEARLPEDVEKTQADRQAKAREKQARADFLARVQAGQFSPEQDAGYLQDVEAVAFGLQDKSWVLRELGRTQSPESAHALLLKLGVWDET
ncbi:MAG: RNB domain-containing ribonuclease, partial [Chloroflexi bacterium]